MIDDMEDHTLPHTVVVSDYWENQVFKPIKGGWCEPFVECLNLTNIGGNQWLSKETKGDRNSLSPEWEWFDKEWAIDKGESHGGVDLDGWSYGPSFGTLFANSKLKILKADKASKYFFRRRRWIRRRRLVSDGEVLQNRTILVNWIKGVEQRMATVANRNEDNYHTVCACFLLGQSDASHQG